MPIRRGTFASSVNQLPTVDIGAVTNFNQDRATFNATVSANYAPTTVYYDYSTTSSFVAFTTVTASTGLTGQNQPVSFNATGLSVGTVYYVRLRAVNGIGSVTSGTTLFTTWSLKTYLNTTAGAFSVSVPSIPGVAPAIYEMLIYGGGGSAAYGGGGGGGYRLSASHVSSTGGSQSVTGTVGAGGPYNSSNAQPAPSGGNSTITVGSTTWTAGGGTGGGWLTSAAGTAGSGDNPQHGGGTGYYGYTYFTGNYVQVVVGYNNYCCATDKYGNCTQYCPDYNSPIYGPDYSQPIYATDYNRYAGGGGGGTDGGGANAGYPDVGGNGGPGGGAYGLRGGNGGGGGGTAAWGSAGSVAAGSGPIVGTGGTGWWNAGVAGGVTFKYYGP
jgi:hypothetical protein